MSKKVLIISSSPRKGGNSDVLCDKFLEGAVSAGNEVEKIFLKDKKINYCIGCGFCTKNDYTGCSQKDDDAMEIIDKMIEADVIVLGTPVYFYTMCAQLKTLIDRCCSKYTRILNKEFYYIATAGEDADTALNGTVASLDCFLECLSGAELKGTIRGAGLWQYGDVNTSKYIEQAYEMGKAV